MSETATITRIDLEETPGEGVLRRMWRAPWREGELPESETFLPGRTLLPLLQDAERKGWTVTQFSPTTAQLLRGEIVRVDVTRSAFGTVVSRFPYGWQASTNPYREVGVEGTIESLIAPYADRGWHVYRWEDGARAFAPGHRRPVRNAGTIRRMRSDLAAPRREPNGSTRSTLVDLAYEL